LWMGSNDPGYKTLATFTPVVGRLLQSALPVGDSYP